MSGGGALAQEFPITGRIAGFVDHLRLNDFAVGPAETAAALEMFSRGGITDPEASRRALKVLLAGRQEEWRRFDDLFEAYWFARGRERVGGAGASHRKTSARRPTIWSDHLGADDTGAAARQGVRPGEADDSGSGSTSRLVASEQKNIQKTDLRHIAQAEEIAEAERLAWRLASAMRHRICRRYRPDAAGRRLDLRRTIRRNISHGGEPFRLVGKARPDRPVRIVVFLDVSGSMKLYSRFFLQFVKGLVCEWIHADAYLVHTKLIRVTDALEEKDSVKAMTRLALMADGFGGGTKLGESLRTFNDHHARRATNSRTVAIILSDGYDTGTPELLQAELARLKRRVRRLVWLNPVLGWQDYEPITRAMALALPLIDHFAAANTLEALAAIEADLARL
jgi:uncharacterized protein with von Willebrand factor type A (vWA) domain